MLISLLQFTANATIFICGTPIIWSFRSKKLIFTQNRQIANLFCSTALSLFCFLLVVLTNLKRLLVVYPYYFKTFEAVKHFYFKPKIVATQTFNFFSLLHGLNSVCVCISVAHITSLIQFQCRLQHLQSSELVLI